MSVYNVSSPWTTQAGQSIALSSLRGEPVVAAMVYTHCPDVCPLITERMQMIEQALPPHTRDAVRFVLISLDWARDTPSQLAKFAAQHRLDMKHWTLLHGDEMAVRELANVLGVDFYRNDSGDFQHSIVIFLLDRNGVVKAQQTDMLAPPATMTAHILALLRDGGRQSGRPSP
jgi:protein SCO1/2